jgi:hypothetical protein
MLPNQVNFWFWRNPEAAVISGASGGPQTSDDILSDAPDVHSKRRPQAEVVSR